VFSSAGRVGLSRGNRLEEEVWNGFHSGPARLAMVAAAIRDQLVRTDEIVESNAEDGVGPALLLDIEEAPEGRLLTVVHQRRERNRKLVEAKKARVLSEQGRLA